MPGTDRRTMLRAMLVAPVICAAGTGRAAVQPPGTRVILDNDWAGDPDGLVQLAHHLLCPTIDIPLVVSSRLPATFGGGHAAADGAVQAREVMKWVGQDRPCVAGSEDGFTASAGATRPATAAIVREAMRPGANSPIVYAAGAGLTELALACRAMPGLDRRLRLIWIGGHEYPGIGATPPQPDEPEFNFSIDPAAAQYVFNETAVEIWQVPRDVYRQMLFGNGELDALGADSRIGTRLKARIDAIPEVLSRMPGMKPIQPTDAYVLGDSPLVTLSALLTTFQPEPASCRWVVQPTPRLGPDGRYTARPGGPPMRVFTHIDARLTFEDMKGRFRAHQQRTARTAD